MTRLETVSFVVKVCGITNEEDARVATAAGANALGFNFYPQSPRFITPACAHEIVRSVPGSFLKVGVFVNASEPELMHTAAEVPLDVLQLHGDFCPSQALNSHRVWKSTNAVDSSSVALPYAEAYLLDTPSAAYGGSGKCFDWSLAAAFPYRKIIAGGLDSANVAEAIRITSPWGVDACSRLESRPGKKDAQRVRDFVRNALAAIPRSSDSPQEVSA